MHSHVGPVIRHQGNVPKHLRTEFVPGAPTLVLVCNINGSCLYKKSRHGDVISPRLHMSSLFPACTSWSSGAIAVLRGTLPSLLVEHGARIAPGLVVHPTRLSQLMQHLLIPPRRAGGLSSCDAKKGIQTPDVYVDNQSTIDWRSLPGHLGFMTRFQRVSSHGSNFPVEFRQSKGSAHIHGTSEHDASTKSYQNTPSTLWSP